MCKQVYSNNTNYQLHANLFSYVMDTLLGINY